MEARVAKMETKRNVKGLIKALSYPHSDVCSFAAYALGRIGDPLAVAPLIVALKEGGLNIREGAAHALGQIADPRAVAPLIVAAKTESSNYYSRDDAFSLRKTAVVALGKIGDARTVEPLIAATHDGHEDVRYEAKRALERIANPEAVEGLLVALKKYSADENVCRAVLHSLGTIGDPLAVEPLTEILRNRCSAVRGTSAWALGQIGDIRAVESLIAAFKEGDTYLQRSAAFALGQIGDGRAVQPLIAALKEGDDERLKCAAEALGNIANTHAIAPLVEVLGNSDALMRGDTIPFVGRVVADALDKLGWQPGQDESGAAYCVVRGQWERCIEIGKPSVAPLMAALKEWDEDSRSAAVKALMRIGDVRAVGSLIDAFLKKDSGYFVNQAAEGVFAKFGRAAVDSLVVALRLQDKHAYRVRRYRAVWALGQFGDAREVDWLISELNRTGYHGKGEEAEALGKIGDARAVAPLIAALKYGEPAAVAAAVALGKIGTARAVEPLIAALSAPWWSLRVAAAESLVRLYQSGSLAEADKQFILAQRDRIVEPHYKREHDDYEGGYWVDERGIGVEFPI
jgi:HEAT repeat protein